jgi:glucose/arabinose dehydrogenase
MNMWRQRKVVVPVGVALIALALLINAWARPGASELDRPDGVVLAQEAATATPAPEQAEAVPAAQEATATEAVTESAQMTETGQVTETGAATATQTSANPLIPPDRAGVLTPSESLPVDLSLQAEVVAEGLIDPVNVASPRDGSGRLFVVERHGVIRIVTPEGEVLEEPFLDIQDIVLTAFLEQGLYDIEFHPDYAENGRFFIHFAEILRNGDGMIVEYSVSSEDPNKADPESAKVIMQLEQPWANHNGGELAFGPDGYLYIGSGDGGWEGDPLGAGQDLSTLLGKVLRIDVDVQDGRPYAIPQDNPFADAQSPKLVQLFGVTEEEFARIHTEARPEIWAYGLRNPWKFSFDRKTGDLYLPDVGQNWWEEIHFQPADSQGGENYGWDFLMGSHCFPVDLEECPAVGVLPVAEYGHAEHGGCAIVGIGIYRGEQYPAMDGIYFSGDYCSGKIWGLMQSEEGGWAYGLALDTDTQITGAGEAENGDLYFTTCNCNYGGPEPQENPPGALWRLVPAE